jgi:hypothetical protein
MNLYATPYEFRRSLGLSLDIPITDEEWNEWNLQALYLERESRYGDITCHRHFYTVDTTRYFDTRNSEVAIVDDLLEVKEVAIDVNGNGSFDYVLDSSSYMIKPYNGYPKSQIILRHGCLGHFHNQKMSLRVTGIFGYGNETAYPWKYEFVGFTLDTTSYSFEVGISSNIMSAVGATCKVDDEQIYISSVSWDGTSDKADLIIERGINQTIPADHSNAILESAIYPVLCKHNVIVSSNEAWSTRLNEAMISEQIGDYRYQRRDFTTETLKNRDRILWGPLIRDFIL